jgi:hypothetical protein
MDKNAKLQYDALINVIGSLTDACKSLREDSKRLHEENCKLFAYCRSLEEQIAYSQERISAAEKSAQ